MTKARASEAFDLLKQGREKEARGILEEIVRADLADAAVLETLGDVREKLGDKTGALDAYTGAVTHLRARGETRRAIGVLELMLLVDEQNLWAHVEGAEIRADLDDNAGVWREVLAACDIWLMRDQQVSALRFARRYAGALPEAAPALQLTKRLEGVGVDELAALCVELGNALRRKDKLDDALALYARALEVAPWHRAARHARAGALLVTGRVAEARVVVDQILSADADDLVALGLLERIAALLGDEAGVRDARDRFERVASHNVDVREQREDTPPELLWSEDTAELRPDTEDDPTDIER